MKITNGFFLASLTYLSLLAGIPKTSANSCQIASETVTQILLLQDSRITSNRNLSCYETRLASAQTGKFGIKQAGLEQFQAQKNITASPSPIVTPASSAQTDISLPVLILLGVAIFLTLGNIALIIFFFKHYNLQSKKVLDYLEIASKSPRRSRGDKAANLNHPKIGDDLEKNSTQIINSLNSESSKIYQYLRELLVELDLRRKPSKSVLSQEDLPMSGSANFDNPQKQERPTTKALLTAIYDFLSAQCPYQAVVDQKLDDILLQLSSQKQSIESLQASKQSIQSAQELTNNWDSQKNGPTPVENTDFQPQETLISQVVIEHLINPFNIAISNQNNSQYIDYFRDTQFFPLTSSAGMEASMGGGPNIKFEMTQDKSQASYLGFEIESNIWLVPNVTSNSYLRLMGHLKNTQEMFCFSSQNANRLEKPALLRRLDNTRFSLEAPGYFKD